LNNPTERSKPEVRAAIQDMKKAMKELQKNQYFRWVDVNDTAIVLGLKRWNENLTAAENLKKEETAKLYTGVHHRRPIASNPSLPREVALATNSPGRLKQ
jgi:hypothetical protein